MKVLYHTYIKTLKDGLNIVVFHVIALVTLLIIYFSLNKYKVIIFGLIILFLLSFILTVNFFRNPSRSIRYKKNVVYAPADGTITSINMVHEKEYLKKKAYRIKIFMNLFNVHRNRIPIEGVIQLVKYVKGKMQAAFKEIEESNEQFVISLKTKHGLIVIKQIAGLIARRIICNVHMGDKAKTGELFGMIKFGSAVITYLPLSTKIIVKKGDKVKAGLTEIGYFKGKKSC